MMVSYVARYPKPNAVMRDRSSISNRHSWAEAGGIMIGRKMYFGRYAHEVDAGALVDENWLYMYVVSRVKGLLLRI